MNQVGKKIRHKKKNSHENNLIMHTKNYIKMCDSFANHLKIHTFVNHSKINRFKNHLKKKITLGKRWV